MKTDGINPFISLSKEYLEAGEALYQLGYASRPLAFCYIQSIELLLKGLAQQQQVLSEPLRKTHDLVALWDSLDGVPNDAKRLVEELSPIDPKTTKFRYPVADEQLWDLDYIRQKVIALHQSLS